MAGKQDEVGRTFHLLQKTHDRDTSPVNVSLSPYFKYQLTQA